MKKNRFPIDIAGQTFGELVAVRHTRNANGILAWMCKCTCGGEKVVTANSLRRGQTTSCGCVGPYSTKWSEHIRQSKIRRRGFGHIRRDSWGYRVACGLLNRSRNGGFEFGFESVAECADYIQSISPTHCPALGMPLVFDNAGRGSGRWSAASVDKIDPNGGYVRGNLQVLSYRANSMKGFATAQELRDFAAWIFRTWPTLGDSQ